MNTDDRPRGRHASVAGALEEPRDRPVRRPVEVDDTAAATVPIRAATGAAGGGADRRRRRRRVPAWVEVPLLLVAALVIVFAVQSYVARVYAIPSGSMETTLHGCPGCSGDRVIVDQVSKRFERPSPGAVIVFRGPSSWVGDGEVPGQDSARPLARGVEAVSSFLSSSTPGEKDFVKRVIATGGQTVACCDSRNRVTVDGRPLPEPYVHYEPGTPAGQARFVPTRLGPDELWVMGDNRNNSADSRVHGPISTADVIGQARLIAWPISRWGSISGAGPSVSGPDGATGR